MKPIQGILFDIDGVLEYQGQVFPKAVETLAALRAGGIALRFLTNSTLKSRASCAARLRRQGFAVADEEVVTASYATACYLRDLQPGLEPGMHPASIWLLLEREGRDEFQEFIQDETNPDYVVVGDARQRFDFATLNHALRLLANGARLIGMQNELTDGSLGELELNVGSWVGMLERASGAPAVYIGKPFPYAFELALRSLGLDRERVLMVGDRVSTDIQGAKNAGLRAALVKTGEFRAADLEGEIQPDWVLESIGGLLPRVLV